jgi:hypothetical protein
MAQADEQVGLLASTLCAVHCAGTGLLVSVAPYLVPRWAQTPAIEFGLLGVSVALGAWTAVRGFRRHRSPLPAVLLIAGLGLAAAGMAMAHGIVGSAHPHGLFDSHGHVHASFGSGAASLAGGGLLVAFFVVNARMRPACACPACVPSGRDPGDELRRAQ